MQSPSGPNGPVRIRCEIDVLDPAGYGALTITKAISIVNDGAGTAGVRKRPPCRRCAEILGTTVRKMSNSAPRDSPPNARSPPTAGFSATL